MRIKYLDFFVSLFLLCTIGSLIIEVLSVIAFVPSHALETQNAQDAKKLFNEVFQHGYPALIKLILFGALIEEFVFRTIPIGLFCEWENTRIVPSIWTLIVIIISSAAFGILHGSVWCIFAQGISGSILSYATVRIVNSLPQNFSRAQKIFTALIFTTFAHATSNMVIFRIAILSDIK